jgi:hypothetical protein
MLIIKGIQCAMAVTYPLPDKELNWRRSPSLPSHDLKEAKSKKTTKDKKQWKKRQEREPLAKAEVVHSHTFYLINTFTNKSVKLKYPVNYRINSLINKFKISNF